MDEAYQVIVIGARAGGLVVAIGAAKAGKKVLLIEKDLFGGDCTNFGCIPSKTLIASAGAIKKGRDLGIQIESQTLSVKGALKRVRETVAKVRSHEDAEALEKLGVVAKVV